ncbi:hypothetical protein LTR37_001996 [Vermiconidia calcicola]|uniref:Uncharacterized protein n=1 Tax=Vermiconidia calcicola TaxID=1690605 RepID=A0ACC3NUE1_9PEZI|nr:hypothetical protein LTR37_001996 [Vermiconidia calcicola]
MARTIRPLQPAPPRQAQPTWPPSHQKTTFYDLPAELRIEIYKLALQTVVLHILPPGTSSARQNPHALVRTSRQIRFEVLPIIHSTCSIRANVTDFNFSGILAFLARIPPDDQKYLLKNDNLSVKLHTTQSIPGNLESLRRWLHYRADVCKPQPRWRYSGPHPSKKVANDMRRRVKRMTTERGKRRELVEMVRAIGVGLPDEVGDEEGVVGEGGD